MEEVKIEVSDEQILEYYKLGYRDEKNGSSTVEPDEEILQMAYSEGAFHRHVEVSAPIYKNDHTPDDKILSVVKSEYIAQKEGLIMMREEAKAEAEEFQRMMDLVKDEKGEEWLEELNEKLGDEYYFNPIIVDKPKGDLQKIDEGELIKEEWVNQTTNGGYTGDDFAGTIYFKLSEGRYLEFGYSM